jgi:hypothetical protein
MLRIKNVLLLNFQYFIKKLFQTRFESKHFWDQQICTCIQVDNNLYNTFHYLITAQKIIILYNYFVDIQNVNQLVINYRSRLSANLWK